MGFWSKLKKIAKKVVQKVKAVVRSVIRIIVEIVIRVINILDLLLGFLAWPPKNLRLHIFILTNANNKPVVSPASLEPTIAFAKKLLKDNFNVNLKSYSKQFTEILPEPAPSYVLETDCDLGALKNEYGDAGDYFASHLAGWNAIPVSLSFPITVFVVSNVKDKQGCSLSVLTDYIVIDPDGVKNLTLMIHEIGHCCGLWHSQGKSNIMFADFDRGDNVKGFQKNILRSSRHVTYW